MYRNRAMSQYEQFDDHYPENHYYDDYDEGINDDHSSNEQPDKSEFHDYNEYVYGIDDNHHITPPHSGSLYQLSSIKDFDGHLHGVGSDDKNIAREYKYQGRVDVNNDGIDEEVYTNRKSGRWATIQPDPLTGQVNYDDYGHGGSNRVVGIYVDPLVESGIVERGSAYDSQQRFYNDIKADNLILRTAGDYDGDGFQEVYWKTADNTAYLRNLWKTR